MYGQYRRLVGASEFGALSGKAVTTGGPSCARRPPALVPCTIWWRSSSTRASLSRASGWPCSGFGNVGWGVVKKTAELGGKVVAIARPRRYIYDPDGAVTDEKINYLLEMRASGRDKVQDYADKFGCEFHAGEKPWGLGADKVDIMMPCATQNDVNMDSAKKIAASGIKYYIEVANMPTTNDALSS